MCSRRPELPNPGQDVITVSDAPARLLSGAHDGSPEAWSSREGDGVLAGAGGDDDELPPRAGAVGGDRAGRSGARRRAPATDWR